MLRTDSLNITPEILSLIARIDEFKGAWRALGTLAPERLSALRRVATIESIGSSTRIEHLLPLAEPPSIDHRELTDKGSINQAAVLARRAALVDDLYALRAALAIRSDGQGGRATT